MSAGCHPLWRELDAVDRVEVRDDADADLDLARALLKLLVPPATDRDGTPRWRCRGVPAGPIPPEQACVGDCHTNRPMTLPSKRWLSSDRGQPTRLWVATAVPPGLSPWLPRLRPRDHLGLASAGPR